ncbi:2',3'-cyclic-nucleotide 2'-phosphodiesterase (5'-nucleotidase family) [Bacillus mesophilus]|uniref:Bifunctional metallophosphatase/5'-nucleotidase n=1 Tax=Bacillus mesophilus TaxID=1808955 RepID=A0A6M0Q756_9BACI|nr:bifunctional UDP-sugar hydrolase/5'-nucleotidase [Bacillus mesophilus]MBM7661442.1 2',3'-cyclic-nucleotide 2'-phosphodiesterase (5'-nucleotidase family) [Bacillus mesophilus]NEY72113.1 bifunctional metallophosphatase/5'-nucleotidase [Bacillus mesophilus]
MKHIHLYHINDLHSHFENWPKVVSYIKQRREVHQREQEEMIVLDIGDHMDRFHPITEATLGKANVRLMNELGYNYATIGNNEGITLSKDQLDSLYSEANFSVLVSNLFEQNGRTPSWVKPYSIHKSSAGINIGLIGLTVPFQKFYQLLGWDVVSPFEIVPSLIQEVKQQGADCIILLSHLGINDDERIAREVEGVDLILGAHTHHLLPDGEEVENTILCGAGKFGMNVGYVKLTIDTTANKISSIEPKVVSIEGQEECYETLSTLQEEAERASRVLSKEVAYIDSPLEVEWYKPSTLANLLAEAIREWCEGEIGMINAGVLLDSLPRGKVTLGDLHRICPHPINPCKVHLKGDQLKEVILQAATPRMEQLKMKGFGFRGKVLGKMVYAGVEVETVVMADGLPHVTSILVNGEAINPEREYIVATLDMFTFGGLYPEISHSKEKQYYLPEMLRDLLQWKLLKNT